MIKFWKHVDYLIPEENKVKITEDEAEDRSKTSMSALSKMQMQQAKKE
jgi:hypothetical protein